jgi:signal transduction histidine kinase
MPIAVPRIGTGIAQIQAIICVPLHAGEEWIGRVTAAYLEPQEFPAQKIRMIEIFANHAGQAIFNAMQYEQRAELAVARERQRIACEMHDTMLQTLVSMNINLRVAIRHARQGDWEKALQVFEQARTLARSPCRRGGIPEQPA